MSRRRAADAAGAAPLEVVIDRLSHEGRGVGRVAGKAVFVHGALPGERVRARILRRHGRYDEAEVTEVLDADAARVAPRCAHFGVCGGCSLQHLDEAAQLAHKQGVLAELLDHQGGVTPGKLAAPITGPQWGYRRKARLGVKLVAKKGGVLVGFRERAKPYVADCRQCDILDPRVGSRLLDLRALIAGLSAPDRVPQIEVAIGDDAVALVLRHLTPLTTADHALLADYARANGLEIFLQGGGYDSVVNLHADGPTRLSYRVAGCVLEFAPTDFTQINAVINARMVARALELLAIGPTDRVVDLFCGLGNFTLPLAVAAAAVHGYEGDAALVAQGTANAALNGLANAHFSVANLAEPAACAALELAGANKLLLDPPRSGALAVVEHAPLAAVERLVYVSCNPVTLARDAAVLVRRHGFHLDESGILDMFPHTAHVESISLFTRG